MELDLNLIISIVTPLVGCGVIFGICKNKIEQNEKEIKELKEKHTEDIKELREDHSKDIQSVLEKQQNTDCLLQEINKQLIELNTKMSLLLKGKISIEE